MASHYAVNVFVNCPFDEQFIKIRNAILFAICDCGFRPRCALEDDNGGIVRMSRILDIIGECKYGIHDISRTELDPVNNLPRFNMPLELGVFLGAKNYGDEQQREKNCLILDGDRFRYQQFISDLSGQDIKSHKNDPAVAIEIVRNWLSATANKYIPGGAAIVKRYREFKRAQPALCKALHLRRNKISYNDYNNIIVGWLECNPPIIPVLRVASAPVAVSK